MTPTQHPVSSQRLMKQAPQEVENFYDTDEAYARYLKLAETAAEKAVKAEKRRQAASRRREEANTDYASNELFAVPVEFDPTAKSNAREEMLAAEKELVEAEEEVAATRKAAATAAAVAMKIAREMEESQAEELDNSMRTSSIDVSLAGSEDDDSSLAGRKSDEDAERAKYRADLAAKDAEQMGNIKEKCAVDPEAHTEEVKLAYETFNEVYSCVASYCCSCRFL